MPALLRKPALAAALERAVGDHPGIIRVSANPASARVLVLHVPQAQDLDIGRILRDALPAAQAAGALKTPQSGQPLTRALAVALPPGRELAGPILWSAVTQAAHFAAGMAFIAAIGAARGRSSPTSRLFGLGSTSAVPVIGAALLLAFADLGCQYQRKRAWQQVAYETRRRLRADLIQRIETQDMAFFDHHGTVRLDGLVVSDTQEIAEFVEHVGDQTIGKAMALVIASAAIAIASPRLALAAVLPLPLLFVPHLLLRQTAAELHARAGADTVRFRQRLQKILAAIADIKSFTGEERELQRLIQSEAAQAESTLAASSVSALESHLIEGIFTIGYTLTAAYGGRLALGGTLRQDQLDRVLFFFPQIAQSIMSVGDTTRRYRNAAGAAARVMDVLDSGPSIRSGPYRLPAAAVRGEIEFENVSFGYDPAVLVLDRVSLVVPPGATLAIVGPTGSGKSTLLRLLMRYYDVVAGRILLDGRDIREIDLDDLRRAIGLVSPDSYLFEGTVRDNVLFAVPDAPVTRLRAALRDAQAEAFVDDLPGRLDAEIGEAGRRLSSGERQRLSIARALLKQAPILALDEVSSHLDYATERAVRTSIRGASRDCTMLIVAHRLSTIRETDEIIVLDRGRIRERGRHQDLVSAGGLYATLWQLESQIERV